jgi:hypothetical protein
MLNEFDLMEDGYARGFPGDTYLMRSRYRTAHGLMRDCEALDGEEPSDRTKPVCRAYSNAGNPPLTSYREFVKKHSKGTK